ncbi:MAG: SIMPL domain-containing protein [Anaerolineae bacterium]|nr:SIMPL domain-containing protein [Anaerolineae bacterium]
MRQSELSMRWIGVLVALAVMSAAAGLALFGPSAALAQEEQPGTITVVGEGKVTIKPDMAQATIGVDITRPTVKEASAEASQVMNRVLGALKELGVAERDMQTSGFSVWQERPYNPDGTQGPPVYHVTNQLNVTIRNLENLGAVLDAAMNAGANNIYGVTFSLSDTAQAEAEARRKAVENARAKAEDLARLTNLQLGEVLSVSEVIGGVSGGYYPGVQRAEGMGGGGPIVPGELEITIQLQVTYSTVR